MVEETGYLQTEWNSEEIELCERHQTNGKIWDNREGRIMKSQDKIE